MKPALAFGPALLVAAAMLGGGCVTRTVYVVDDRDDAPLPAAPRAVASAEPAPRYEDDAGIRRVEDFYEPLSPYGRWVHTPRYGMVFIPSGAVVGAGFRPYTHGHWVQTEWGWTWVDHHPFGWATGHYGSWYYDTSYGWVWVPGTTWAPAWVSWRTGGGYVGWAPMPPGAAFGGAYTVYETSWVFVSYSSMGVGYVGSALIVGPAYRTCYVSTSPYRETYVVYGRRYYRGPREDDVVRAGGHVVHRPIRDVDSERAVTRPPQASTRERDGDDGRRPGRAGRDDGRDDARGAPRDRDDDRGGDDRGRDDDRGDHDRGHGNDPDRDDEDNPGRGRGEPGRPDPRDPNGRGDGRGRGGERDDVGRPASFVDERGAVIDEVTPRIDPAAGAVRDRGDVGVGVGAPDGTGIGRGERPPVGGERGTPARPGGVDLRSPWRDDERPRDRDQEDPEKFRPVTDPFGTHGRPLDGPPVSPRTGDRDLGTPARPIEARPDLRPDARPDARSDARPDVGVDPRGRPALERPSFEPPAIDRPSADPRGPVTPSRPSGLAPRAPDRPAVGAPRPAPQPEAQPAAEQQPSGKGKKGKATKKVDAKKK